MVIHPFLLLSWLMVRLLNSVSELRESCRWLAQAGICHNSSVGQDNAFFIGKLSMTWTSCAEYECEKSKINSKEIAHLQTCPFSFSLLNFLLIFLGKFISLSQKPCWSLFHGLRDTFFLWGEGMSSLCPLHPTKASRTSWSRDVTMTMNPMPTWSIDLLCYGSCSLLHFQGEREKIILKKGEEDERDGREGRVKNKGAKGAKKNHYILVFIKMCFVAGFLP